jgi:hypothetical protein
MDSYSNPFAGHGCEPPIAELINDPLVRLVMRRDKVSEDTLVEIIESARHSIVRRKSNRPTHAA